MSPLTVIHHHVASPRNMDIQATGNGPSKMHLFLMCIDRNSGYQRGRHGFAMEGGADMRRIGGKKRRREKMQPYFNFLKTQVSDLQCTVFPGEP